MPFRTVALPLTLLFALAALLSASGAAAHPVGLSRSEVAVVAPGDVRVAIVLSGGELVSGIPFDTDGDGLVDDAEIAARKHELARIFSDALAVTVDDAPCVLAFGGAHVEERDGLVLEGRAACESAGERLTVTAHLLEDLPPRHRHLLRITAGKVRLERLLTRDDRVGSVHVPDELRSTESRAPRSTRLILAVAAGFIAVSLLGLALLWAFRGVTQR